MMSVNMGSSGVRGEIERQVVEHLSQEFREEGWPEAGRRQHMYLHTHPSVWVLYSPSVTFRDMGMQELGVRTERQNRHRGGGRG